MLHQDVVPGRIRVPQHRSPSSECLRAFEGAQGHLGMSAVEKVLNRCLQNCIIQWAQGVGTLRISCCTTHRERTACGVAICQHGIARNSAWTRPQKVSAECAGLQVFSDVHDPWKSCSLTRLSNGANHVAASGDGVGYGEWTRPRLR